MCVKFSGRGRWKGEKGERERERRREGEREKGCQQFIAQSQLRHTCTSFITPLLSPPGLTSLPQRYLTSKKRILYLEANKQNVQIAFVSTNAISAIYVTDS